mgnify:CR=1 FL=1
MAPLNVLVACIGATPRSQAVGHKAERQGEEQRTACS